MSYKANNGSSPNVFKYDWSRSCATQGPLKNKIKIIFVLVVAFTLSASTTYATWVNIQITTSQYGYEISWDLTDSNGTVLAYGPSIGGYSDTTTYNHYIDLAEGCYNMNMYDSYGDGWNGGAYNILDSASGVISYANGGLAYGSAGTDVVCIGAFGCTNPLAINYDSTALVNNDSCIFSTCTDVTLYMQDSYGNGWNGSLWTITGVSGGTFGPFTILSGSSGQVNFCLPDDCYNISVTLNQYSYDISWQLIEDSTGNILAEGCNSINPCAFLGCPYNGPTLCLPTIWGCTNPFALNFDSLAHVGISLRISLIFCINFAPCWIKLCGPWDRGWSIGPGMVKTSLSCSLAYSDNL